jgi:hypothetical protein
MSTDIRKRAPKHTHPKHKLCVHCANVVMHDLQCDAGPGECDVVTCVKFGFSADVTYISPTF